MLRRPSYVPISSKGVRQTLNSGNMTQLATHDQSEQVTATRTHGYRTTATNERTGTGDSHVGKGPWRTGGNPLAVPPEIHDRRSLEGNRQKHRPDTPSRTGRQD